MAEVIQTEGAPEAVGAYSQGRVVGDLILTSGQIGLDPDSEELQDDSPVNEIRQGLHNVSAVVSSGGGDNASIVKTRVFLTNLEYYNSLNSVYRDFFADPLPARTVVEVSELPAGASIEIEATAQKTGAR